MASKLAHAAANGNVAFVHARIPVTVALRTCKHPGDTEVPPGCSHLQGEPEPAPPTITA